jgi:2-(1,2-epoxy-1,2-dihydrophenyl)acetyl-CoA isomerase
VAEGLVVSERGEGVTIVRLNRAAGQNALVPELLDPLAQHLEQASALGKPVILTANGSSFCPGADLKWLARCGDPAQGVAELVAVHHLVIRILLHMNVPVVAALNGAVAGGGLGLALAGDYRVAAARATFRAGYFALGLPPDGGASVFLENTLGRLRTMQFLLTNQRLSADEALAWGLVNEVVPDAELEQRAIHVATSFVQVPGYALRTTRGLLDMGETLLQLQREEVAIRTAARGSFFHEALARFVEAHPG